MPLLDTELNRIANDIVSADGEVYIHTGAPGAGGTENRVAGVAAEMAGAADWSDAAAGDVQYDAVLLFGILSAADALTVLYWSYARGGSVRATGEVHDSVGDHGVDVPAGEPFQLNAGTVRINGSSV